MSVLSLIPVGDGDYVSQDFEVPGIGSMLVITATDPARLATARVALMAVGSDGSAISVDSVDGKRPIALIPGAGKYRLVRSALSVGVGAEVYIASAGGGSGDASAANQLTQINRAEQGNSFLLDISNRVATADLQSAGNLVLTNMQGNTSTIAGRIAPISATVARKVAITSTATVVALSSAARYIDFRAKGTDAFYLISAGSPVATPDSHYIGQDERLMRGVGASMSISVLSAGGGSGMLYITER